MEDRKEVRLPKAVYYQCIWTVKDIDRLHRLESMKNHGKREEDFILYEDENCRMMSDEVLNQAEWKLSCIKEALSILPEEYRVETIEGIVDGIYPSGIAHENTWKRWRRIFVKELALKLNLI